MTIQGHTPVAHRCNLAALVRVRLAVTLAACAACLVLAGAVRADLRLPAIFGDHMILQAGTGTPVFGWTDPGETVTVDFAGQSKQAEADADGRWVVRFDPLEASREGRLLTISAGETIELRDVLVGEVWLASGQSNMAMNVAKSEGGAEAVTSSTSPLVRVFRVSPKGISPLEPLDDCSGQWATAAPESVADLSAVGYFFIRQLQSELDVPVGLVDSAWGGTTCESWTSREGLLSDPVTRPIWQDFRELVDAYDPATTTPAEEAKRLLDDFRRLKAEAQQAGRPRPRLPKIVQSPANKRYTPCNFFNTMIHPVIPYGIRGVLWYQGEGNRFQAAQYQTLFPLMIRDWRRRWGRPGLPFYFVQLANIKDPPDEPIESQWAELQWAQLLTLRRTPHTGMAVINDGTDLSLHPRHKKMVADRLLLWALANTYGREDVAFTGPIYKSFEKQGGKIRVSFDYAEGLCSRDGRPLRGFQIAGADRDWVWANAEVVEGDVLVWSPAVENPVAVRYAWSDNPGGANLTNTSSLPVSLFKTDDWPGPWAGSLVPAISGPYVHVYRPGPDVFPGPDTPRLRAGQRYEDWTPNDHAIVKGPDDRWHAFGITHPSVDSPPWHEGECLSFHAAATPGTLRQQLRKHAWVDLPKVLPPADRPGEPENHHAPFFVRKEGTYWMFYGPNPIRYAVSSDLFRWTPKGPLFEQENGGRDPSIFYHDGQHVMLLTSRTSVVARTSPDLLHWSEPTTIYTMPEGERGAPESASIVEIAGQFYLFWCPWDWEIDDAYQHRTFVFRSDDPLDFHGCRPIAELEAHAPEIFHDEAGDWYISSVEWPHRGVSIAPLTWQCDEAKALK